MLHYRACARTQWAKAKDIALMVFGLATAVFTTVQTVKVRFTSFPSLSPKPLMRPHPGSGDCDPIRPIRGSIRQARSPIGH